MILGCHLEIYFPMILFQMKQLFQMRPEPKIHLGHQKPLRDEILQTLAKYWGTLKHSYLSYSDCSVLIFDSMQPFQSKGKL